MIGFIFCHGWGLNANFWNHLKEHFAAHPCLFWDLGYFNEPSRPLPEKESQTEWFGVGHSLGLIQLLQSDVPFKGLIGLQSFLNFLGNDSRLHQARARFLEKMIADFQKNPLASLKTFHAQCEIEFEIPKTMNANLLQQDFQKLKTDFSNLTPKIPCLILGSSDDPIVPPRLLEDNFKHAPHIQIALHSSGLHGLGCKETGFVLQQIQNFVESHE
ncbi:MAG: hypothetical protein V1746_01380 [bacterium]